MTIVAHAHPFVIYDIEIRTVLFSTNAIESLNAQEVLGAVLGLAGTPHQPPWR